MSNNNDMVSESYRLRLKEAVDALYLPGSPRVTVGLDGTVTLTLWDHYGEAMELSRSYVMELIVALTTLLGVMSDNPAPTCTATLADLWSGVPRVDREGRALSDWHAEVIHVLCRCLRWKPWDNVIKFKSQRAYDKYYSVPIEADLATTDRDELTRLVLAAHERCWRISVAPYGVGLLLVQVSQREPKHPSLEQAIAAWRAR